MSAASSRALVVSILLGLGACGPGPAATPPVSARAATMLPDVRVAKDRPPVVLVSREGDPASAVAIAVTTGDPDEVEPEIAAALAGVVEARLTTRGVRALVTPSWDGYRAVVLATSATEATAAASALATALTTPIEDKDLAPAKRKLAALGARPLRDAALGRWARCVGAPYATPERAGTKASDELALTKLEQWRAAAHGLGHVAIAVTGPAATGESVASAIAQGTPWRTALAAVASAATQASAPLVDVYEAPAETPLAALTVHATMPVPNGSAAVATAEALGDPQGPLATRLAALEMPFRIREIAGTAHARGGCVGVVLEGTTGASAAPADPSALVADAVALVEVEVATHLAEGGAVVDGRALARRAGDARESAERAAWWALADTAPGAAKSSVALGIPRVRGTGAAAPTRDALAAALARASASWQKPVVEGRTRVESGQGEAWVLVASPCGTDGETESDAGLTALVAMAAAVSARPSPEARVEPWLVADGVGLLAHGPALAGESPAAHARRLADVAARAFAADPLPLAAVARARADLQRRSAQGDGAALGVLASALAPGHPSWILAGGLETPALRASDAAVIARADALRAGPLRVAVLANVDAAQAEAAVRAADRWVDRRGRSDGEARACRGGPGASPPRPGTYAAPSRAGAISEAYLAFPFPAGDDGARAQALVVASALDGEGGLLETALGPTLVRSSSARVLGAARAPALVLRLTTAEGQLDAAVMQARALVDRLHKGALPAADLERATAAAARAALATSLDPRARVVALFRGEALAPSAPGMRALPADDVRAFAQKYLGEDALVVVASRPGAPSPPARGARP